MALTLLPGAEKSLFERIIKFFEDDEWNFDKIEDDHSLRMGFKGENGQWHCFARTNEERRVFSFYSVTDALVPEDKRPAMAEFITRANYGMIVGNFEMDFSDGEIRFKTVIAVEDGLLTHEMIKRNVYVNLMMMDQYFPGLMSVMYVGVEPAEAVAKIEE